jgi:hypothetical protein
MRSPNRYLRTAAALAIALPMVGVPAMTRPAFAQTAPVPTCQPGYYYASDGYCYPQPQPSYAPPPPVYDAAPPSYQSSSDVAGVAIGVGLGLLVGALAANAGDRHHAAPAREQRGRRDRDRR